jgi:microcystin-dependent protein
MSEIKTDKITGFSNPNIIEIAVGIEDVYLDDLYNKSYHPSNIITPTDIINKGPTIDPRAFDAAMGSSTLALAIAYIAGAQRTIVIPPGVWEITGNLTFPSNICVQFLNGAIFNVTGSVTFQGPILAGNYRIFTGSGSISIATTTPLTYDVWDGSIGNGITFLTWPSLPAGDPTNTLHAAPKGYVDNLVVPVGGIIPFGGGTAPTHFKLCDGAAISRGTYTTLYSVIGTTYGTGDGSTTFNVPNLKGRIPVGLNSTDSDFQVLGQTGGEKEHILATDEIPLISLNTGYLAGGSPSNSFCARQTSNGHNNLQPYVVLNYIIRY